MAEESNSETQEESAAPAKKGRGLIVAFVAVVVMVETAMFFFLIPSAEQVSAMAEANLIDSVQQAEADAEQQADDGNALIEVDLGEFGETFSPIDSEGTYKVELQLYGLIREKDKEKMEAEQKAKNGRLQHEIRMKIRNSELGELQDNQLALLQRRILTKCNHQLDEDLLVGVGFKRYQLIEE
ncbi:MAG: dihydrolipoamide acetyltransferase [Planctomycetota bacterium]